MRWGGTGSNLCPTHHQSGDRGRRNCPEHVYNQSHMLNHTIGFLYLHVCMIQRNRACAYTNIYNILCTDAWMYVYAQALFCLYDICQQLFGLLTLSKGRDATQPVYRVGEGAIYVCYNLCIIHCRWWAACVCVCVCVCMVL